MSQIILDEQLNWRLVLEPVRRWITARKIEDMRPYETIKDDRVLQILCGLKQPTTPQRKFTNSLLVSGEW